MSASVWRQVIAILETEFQSDLFRMWIQPLQIEEAADALTLLAPNQFFMRHIQEQFLPRIQALVTDLSVGRVTQVSIRVGSRGDPSANDSRL